MRLWLWPTVIGLLCAIGLVVGLVSHGIGDIMAWIGLGIPVVVAARCSLRKPKRDC